MLTDALLARCAAIATSTWSDAIDAVGFGAVSGGLTWRCGTGRVAGRALTVQEECKALGSFSHADFTIGEALKLGRPGDVLVVAMGGAPISTFGGLAAKSAAAKGIVATIIDGGCRDIEELRTSGLVVASRHITPMTGRGRVRVNSINEPIACDGVMVAAGDLVVADETGIVFVPLDSVGAVLEAAERLERRDQTMQRALDRGVSFSDVISREN